jgi:hypothetical protein
MADYRLICFVDGSYLELYAFRPPIDAGKGHRWFPYAEVGEGLCDYSVATADLDGLLARVDASGLRHAPVEEGGRARLDGMEFKLRALRLGLGATTPALPFVVEDVTPRRVRVSGDTVHANRATGVQSVTVVTDDPDGAHDGLALLTGCTAPTAADHDDGMVRRYPFGDREIRVLVPREGSDGWKRLEQVGPVLYEIQVKATAGQSGQLRLGSAKQTRIALA